MSRVHSALFASLLATNFVALPALAHADGFYKGKTVTIIVGFSSGGQYDLYARTLARFLPAHIPGHPTVIVQNMPGAGSLVAARSLVATQPKDGTVMATVNDGLIVESIVEPQLVKLDFRKLAWVGVITADFRVCYGYGPKGVKSWSDMMHRKQFVMGATGKGSGDYINAATLREVFGAPIKQVLGFPGAAEERLAVARGELDGDCSNFKAIPVDWIRDHKAHPFVRFTKARTPDMPKAARFIGDFATTQDQRNLLKLLDSGNELGRPYVMSAKVPAGRLAIMRKAFNDTMKDPGFLAQAEKERLPVHPLTGQEATRIAAEIKTVSPSIVTKAKKVFE